MAAKGKRAFPHTYVIVFGLILLAAALTWIVPGGAFERQTVEVNGIARSVVVADSFHAEAHSPQSWQVLPAIFRGLERTADIIFYILIIGGAFWILNTSHALDVAITSFLRAARRLEHLRFLKFLGVDNLIVVLIMLCFSFFGAVIGMSEETIAFVVIFVPLAISMGYDSIVGVSMCFLAAGLGFAGALLNPFTIGIAQGLAGIPLFSGIEYRLVIWLVVNTIGIGYVLRYMARLRKDPRRSPVYEEDSYWRERASADAGMAHEASSRATWWVYGLVGLGLLLVSWFHPTSVLTAGQSQITLPILPALTGLWWVIGFLSLRHSVQMFIVHMLLTTILMLVVGVMGYGWYIKEIASLFLALGLCSGIAYRKSANELVKLFIQGAGDILSAALVVGLASGIVIVLEDGRIIDTILSSSADEMMGYGPVASLLIMYVFYTLLNLIIASGSAKAALTIPLMSQFSDLLGISRQATVTAYQLGGGFTNLATPTSGVMVGVLSIARVPYIKWLKWFWPLLAILIVVGGLLLVPTVLVSLSGF